MLSEEEKLVGGFMGNFFRDKAKDFILSKLTDVLKQVKDGDFSVIAGFEDTIVGFISGQFKSIPPELIREQLHLAAKIYAAMMVSKGNSGVLLGSAAGLELEITDADIAVASACCSMNTSAAPGQEIDPTTGMPITTILAIGGFVLKLIELRRSRRAK